MKPTWPRSTSAIVNALRGDGWTLVDVDVAYADPVGQLMPDTPAAQGTLSEMVAWEKGLLAPRWYEYTNAALARQAFDEKVLGETLPQ